MMAVMDLVGAGQTHIEWPTIEQAVQAASWFPAAAERCLMYAGRRLEQSQDPTRRLRMRELIIDGLLGAAHTALESAPQSARRCTRAAEKKLAFAQRCFERVQHLGGPAHDKLHLRDARLAIARALLDEAVRIAEAAPYQAKYKLSEACRFIRKAQEEGPAPSVVVALRDAYAALARTMIVRAATQPMGDLDCAPGALRMAEEFAAQAQQLGSRIDIQVETARLSSCPTKAWLPALPAFAWMEMRASP